MNISKWLIFHAAALILVGLIFLLYSPLVIAWLGLTQIVQDSQGYWAMVSFARLFGMALMAWGAMTLTARQITAQPGAQGANLRKILLILVLGDFLGAFSAAIQAASVWGNAQSWAISIAFGLLGVGGLLLFIFSRRDEP